MNEPSDLYVLVLIKDGHGGIFGSGRPWTPAVYTAKDIRKYDPPKGCIWGLMLP